MSLAVVLGAGPVGSAATRSLIEQGRDVLVVTRSGTPVAGARAAAADASSLDALLAATSVADVVVNALNPRYHRWPQDWPPMAAAIDAYAERAGAVLVTCSNLYPYGPVDGPITTARPDAATGTKAQVRARMWATTKALHDAGRIRAAEVRGSDYICPGAGSRLGDLMTGRLIADRKPTVIGRVDLPHSWTSPDDVGRIIAAVAADESALGRVWHVPTNPPRTQQEAADDICAVAGIEPVRLKPVPPAALAVIGMFNPLVRELRETAYQFQRPYVIDDADTRARFGLAPAPWPELVGALVASYRQAR